jgi:hypothetical protein
MFTYNLTHDNPRGPMVEILDGANIIDESGPWESIQSASTWAEA